MNYPTPGQLARRQRNEDHLAQLRAEQALRDRASEIPALEARIAELEQLAADILATFSDRAAVYGGGTWSVRSRWVYADDIDRWHSTLEGTP